ncbi:MAG: DUF3887 domain-containing protein [Christensenella sp.]|nr:DUF3887 domain-containing protein [Christensenella sp.]
MQKQLKTIVCAVLALTLVLGLFGCAGKALPDGFDAEEVGSAAEEVVGLATAGDYDSIITSMRADLQTGITADQLKEGWASIYEKAGAFKSITKTVLSGTEDATTKEAYAVAQVQVKHEDANLLYTLSFDKDLALVGIYLK